MLGDCLEKMKEIPDESVDMVLADPPYGSTSCKWDIIIPFEPLWKELNRVAKKSSPIILFGQEPFSSFQRLSNIENFKYDWYWKKERLTNIFQVKRRPGKVVETISVFYRDQCNYFPQKTVHEGPKRKNKIKEILNTDQDTKGSFPSHSGRENTDTIDDGTISMVL
jgi:site-specific DNA-methyltransferase (adenine-specific)